MDRPLEGIRVLDFTIFQQGGYATVILSDLGAEIIKVERPGFGDFSRYIGLFGEPGAMVSPYFVAHDRGKRSITLDLQNPLAREVVARIVPSVDIVMHNFRPGVMERLGLGYDDLAVHNPRLIYGAASGWGATGPDAGRPSFDIAAQAQGGIIAATGDDGGPPVPAGAAIADHVGAVNFALGVVTLLARRGITGQGGRVDVSLFGSQLAMQAWEITHTLLTGEPQRRSGRGHALLPTIWRVFETADGHLVVGGVGDDRWPAFCRIMGIERLEQDARFADGQTRSANLAALYEVLDPLFSGRPTAEWIAMLAQEDLIYAPVTRYEDLANNPQALENGYVAALEHPALGTVRIVGSPFRVDGTPLTPAGAEPQLGADTEQVLQEAGYTWDDIARFRDKGLY